MLQLEKNPHRIIGPKITFYLLVSREWFK